MTVRNTASLRRPIDRRRNDRLRLEPLESRLMLSGPGDDWVRDAMGFANAASFGREHTPPADRLQANSVVLGAMSEMPSSAGVGFAPAGFDLFETDPSMTRFRFTGRTAIPASFFDPGSRPFRGTVPLAGVPLGNFQGQGSGSADTIVERKEDASLAGPTPQRDTVPIELVELSLESVAPIRVRVGRAFQLWEVHVSPSPSRPSTGTMTITASAASGGTFDSQLAVYPLFRFTRASDGAEKVLDVGAMNLSAGSVSRLTLRAAGVPWVATCPDPALVMAGLNDGFCASASASGEQVTVQRFALGMHAVKPARRVAATPLSGPGTERANEHLPEQFPLGLDPSELVEVQDSIAISFTRLLLVLDETTTVNQANDLLASIDATIVGGLPVGHVLFIRVPLGRLDEMMPLLTRLNADPRVDMALPELGGAPEALPPYNVTPGLWDWQVPDVSAMPPQHPTDGNWGLEMIRAPQMWNLDTFVRRNRAGTPVSAAVVDSGFTDALAAPGNSTHPDFIRGDGTTLLQILPAVGPMGPVAAPVSDHGTLVAGTIGAAADNGQGTEGVNPWLSRIIGSPSVFQSNMPATWGQQLAAISGLLVAAPDIRAVNNSYGLSSAYQARDSVDDNMPNGSFNPTVLEFGEIDGDNNHTDFWFVDRNGDGVAQNAEIVAQEWPAIDADTDGTADTWSQVVAFYGNLYNTTLNTLAVLLNREFVIVASAGNAGASYNAVDNSPIANAAVQFGGRFLAVQSLKNDGTVSSFSDSGGTIFAPGECIRGPEANDMTAFDTDPTCAWRDGAGMVAVNPLYATNSGTSFAAPHVTGLATALWKLEPDLTLDQLRTLLTGADYTVATSVGGPRRIDAFRAAIGIDQVTADPVTGDDRRLQQALVDVDDGTPDGNQRTLRDDRNMVAGTHESVSTPDALRGDGEISMSDFRAFRDAVIESLLGEPGGLSASQVALDGPDSHFKFDLNFDGCVRGLFALPVHPSGTIPLPPNCTTTPETIYSRYDFNGNGRLDNATAPFKGVNKTDLDVLLDLWPRGVDPATRAMTEDWTAGELASLLPFAGGSADLEFRAGVQLGGPHLYDEIRIGISGRPAQRSLTADQTSLVWTVPIASPITLTAEGYKNGAKVTDLCTSGSSPLTGLLQGQDAVVSVGDCVGPRIVLTSGYRAGNFVGGVGTTILESASRTETFRCGPLAVGQVCEASTETVANFSAGSITVRLTHVAENEWLYESSSHASAVRPPLRAGVICGLESGVQCGVDANNSAGSELVLPLPDLGNIRVTLQCVASGESKAPAFPAPQSSTSFTNFISRVPTGVPDCLGGDGTMDWSVNSSVPIVMNAADGAEFDTAAAAFAKQNVSGFDPGLDYAFEASVSAMIRIDILIEDLPG